VTIGDAAFYQITLDTCIGVNIILALVIFAFLGITFSSNIMKDTWMAKIAGVDNERG